MRNRKCLTGMSVLISFMMLCMASCTRQDKHASSATHFAANIMTIDYHIIVGNALSENEKTRIQKIIDTTFQEINEVYNKWNPQSELSKLNLLHKGETSPLSPQLESFLKKVDDIHQLTEGRFDPTIEPIQQLWKQALEKGSTPSAEEIQKNAASVGWDKIHYGNGIFYKDHDLTRLDLSGIAKGYCVDLLVERINAGGYADVFVEWGGEIRCSGKHPDNRPWNIFISRLGDRNPSHAIATLRLYNQAIATSGDYQQQWLVKDSDNTSRVYSHIFDPTTLQPLISHPDSIASASVLASNCTLADGLATAAMLFLSVEEAEKWAKRVQNRFPDITFWFATHEQ